MLQSFMHHLNFELKSCDKTTWDAICDAKKVRSAENAKGIQKVFKLYAIKLFMESSLRFRRIFGHEKFCLNSQPSHKRPA